MFQAYGAAYAKVLSGGWGWEGRSKAAGESSEPSRAEWGRTGGHGASGLDLNPSSITYYLSGLG